MHTEIDVENRDGKVFDGMYAETNIVLNKKDNALTIPVQAVERNGGNASVMTVDAQGQIHERTITLGVESSDRVEVLSGLRADDRVVLGSRSEFREGEQVTPELTERIETSSEGGL